MPRTRNITRAQWDAANSASATHGHESEKENQNVLSARSDTAAGRRNSRSTATGGRTVLGGITTTNAASTATKAKTAAKAKDKGKGKKTTTKTKKQPLQDITKHFLPAPEAANRGQGVAAAVAPSSESAAEVQSTIALAPSPAAPAINAVRSDILVNTHPTFPSPLPPSSPPSASSVSSPLHIQQLPGAFQHLLPIPSPSSAHVFTGVGEREPDVEEEEAYNPWNSFDVRPSEEEEGNDNPTPTNSDPFGFFALERKLKVQREEKYHQDQGDEDEDQWEDGGLILVADTSSPRNVPRLSQQQKNALALGQVSDADADAEGEEVEEGPYFNTPPTPHKSKKKRRISFEAAEDPEKDFFSVHTSSAPSSPSPSKIAESRKRKPIYDHEQVDDEEEGPEVDLLEEAGEAKGKKRARIHGAAAAPTEEGTELRRGRSASIKRKADDVDAEVDENESPEKKPKMKTKVATVKPASKTAKTKSRMKQNKKEADSETQEKFEQDRQARVEYFKSLEGYEVETENVYVV